MTTFTNIITHKFNSICKSRTLLKNFRLCIALLTILAAQTAMVHAKTTANNAHAAAHSRQLANVNRLDKRTIQDMMKQDLEQREAELEMSVENATIANDLLKEANKHIGKRYVRGAKGPSQFDCSGFSSYVFRQFGYNLSSSSRAQYTQGTPVKRNELRKGDLVFFTSRRSGGNVGHVGIVVEADTESGNFKFIHASTSKGIKIDKCDGYYASRYIGARRIIAE